MNKHQPPEVWLRRVRAVFFAFALGFRVTASAFRVRMFFFVFWRPVGAGLPARFSDLEGLRGEVLGFGLHVGPTARGFGAHLLGD